MTSDLTFQGKLRHVLTTLAVVLLESARYARARYARSIVQRSLRSQAPQMAAICQQPNSRTRPAGRNGGGQGCSAHCALQTR